MKITDIKQQVKRQDRYSIYIDEKYAFSIGETELLNAGLRNNQEFTKDELEDLKQRAVLDKAYDRALNLIARRPRSEWELRDYLKRKDYDSETTETIIELLRDKGYVNDKAFATAWVNTRRLLKSTSKRRLMLELRQKRVSDDTIQQVIEEDEVDELDVLRELIARKRKQTRYQDDMKLTHYLIRQGYNYSDIKNVLSQYSE